MGLDRPWFLPAAILAFGSALRLYGLDWGVTSLRTVDDGVTQLSIGEASFHPDADTLTQVTASLAESIHPFLLVNGEPLLYSVYGPVFMYLFQVAARFLALFVDFAPFDLLDLVSNDWTRLAGRSVSAGAGCATLWLTYRLGSIVANRTTGLVASLLLGVTALHIQSSHFCTVDVLMTFWATWSLLLMVRMTTSGARGDYLKAGALIALAAATKLNALVLLLPFVLAHGLWGRSAGQRLASIRVHVPIFLGLTATLLIFAFLVPSAWLRPLDYFGPTYHGNVLYSALLNDGAVLMRGSLHYAGTPSYLFQLFDLFPAGLGVSLEIAAIGGCFYALTTRRNPDLLLAGFVLVYFVVVGNFETKYIRYFVVLTPPLAVLGARVLTDLWNRPSSALLRGLGGAVGVIVVLTCVAYGVAVSSMYGRPDPRVEAIGWLAERVPPGGTVTVERGHNSMSSLVSASGLQHRDIDLAHFFGRETSVDLLRSGDYLGYYLAGPLAASEYLVFSEDQLAARLNNPFVTQYYAALFSGDLGFALERKFDLQPQLAGFIWDDGGADISWRHFDHPTVFIFRRSGSAKATRFPRPDIYLLRTRQAAQKVVQRAIEFQEFLFFELCLPDVLRHGSEPEHIVRLVNELLSRPGILPQLLMPKAYVEQEGQWRLNLVDVDGSYQLRLL
tara:strand:- start:43 stop:2058 length:2016 start_codon:yes stop_codon:yes gene_type:complete